MNIGTAFLRLIEEKITPRELNSMKILVADDKADTRVFLKHLLTMEGHDVTLASNGREALGLAQDAPPDLIISDILMPEMDGFRLCQAIREYTRLNSVSFVFYSAVFDDESDKQLCMDLGATDYIDKPSDPEAFVARIRDAVSKTGQPPAERPSMHALSALSLKIESRLADKLVMQTEQMDATKRSLDTLIANLPGIVYRRPLDGDQAFDFISDHWGTVTGYPADALEQGRGLTFNELVYPADQQAVTESLQQALANKACYFLSYRILTKDGTLRSVEDSGCVARDSKGYELLEGYISDVTDQRAASIQQQRFFELGLDLFCIAEPKGKFIQVSPSWTRVLGWSKEELLSRPWIEFVHPSHRDSKESALETLQGGQTIHHFQNRYLCKDGGTRWLSWNTMPLADEALVYGVARDITAERQAEEKNKLLSEALKQSASPTALLGLNLNIFFVNSAFEHLFGFEANELKGQNIAVISPEESRGTASDTEIIEEIDRSGFFSGEVNRQTKNGDWIPVLLTAAPLIGDGGKKKLGFISTYQPLQSIKDAEEKLSTALSSMIAAMARTIEKRDPYTAGHQERVAELAEAIARKMELTEGEVKGISMGCLIHDVGKIHIPAEILTRPGRLSELEFGMVQQHPQVGYEIMKDIEFDWPVQNVIYQHHERLDGSGYPLGLSGDEISLAARIAAVADVVEAMTSHRPYRTGLGLEVALDEIQSKAGSAFDNDVVQACIRVFKDGDFKWSTSF